MHIINYDSAITIYKELKISKHEKLIKRLFELSIRYAEIRAEYSLLPLEEKEKLKEERTNAHNALIDQCNIISRTQANTGEDNT